MKGDYHIHTYYSDGVFSPEKIVDLALEAGLQAISLTDHDNVLSYNVAVDYLKTKEVDLKIIQGIEVNTLYKEYEVHILGYFPDVTKSDFKNLLKIQQQARTKQTKEILALLGFNPEELPDGTLSIEEYCQPSDFFTFSDLGIDENKLLEMVGEIRQDAVLEDSLRALPNFSATLQEQSLFWGAHPLLAS